MASVKQSVIKNKKKRCPIYIEEGEKSMLVERKEVIDISEEQAAQLMRKLESMRREGRGPHVCLGVVMAEGLPIFEDAWGVWEELEGTLAPWEFIGSGYVREIRDRYYKNVIFSPEPLGYKLGSVTALFEYTFLLMQEEQSQIKQPVS